MFFDSIITSKQYFNDILHHLLSCFALPTHSKIRPVGNAACLNYYTRGKDYYSMQEFTPILCTLCLCQSLAQCLHALEFNKIYSPVSYIPSGLNKCFKIMFQLFYATFLRLCNASQPRNNTNSTTGNREWDGCWHNTQAVWLVIKSLKIPRLNAAA